MFTSQDMFQLSLALNSHSVHMHELMALHFVASAPHIPEQLLKSMSSMRRFPRWRSLRIHIHDPTTLLSSLASNAFPLFQIPKLPCSGAMSFINRES
jgi:hypothetical protein